MDTEYRFFSKNVLSVIVLSLIVVVSLAGCVTENREEAMREAASTDLSTEHIDGIMPGMVITDAEFIQEHGHFELHPDNDYYAPRRDYDQYWDDHFIISVDRSTKEVLAISPLEGNNDSSTAKGITLGTPIDEVIAAYGEDYYTYTEREQDIYEIGYVDHDKNLNILFLHLNDKVVHINFGYAFDRMNWVD